MSITKNNKNIEEVSINNFTINEIYLGSSLVFSSIPKVAEVVFKEINNGVLSNASGGIFDKVVVVDNNALENTFKNNTNLKGAVSFPNLTIVKEEGLRSCFEGCENLTSVSFPNLTTIKQFGLREAFYYCPLTSVSFPKLTTIDFGGLESCFYSCEQLTSVSFPKLTTIDYGGLRYCFSFCSALKEIHFRADVRSVVESLYGYSNNFGAYDATIYFDL